MHKFQPQETAEETTWNDSSPDQDSSSKWLGTAAKSAGGSKKLKEAACDWGSRKGRSNAHLSTLLRPSLLIHLFLEL